MDSDCNLFDVNQKPIPTCFNKCNFKPGQPFGFKVSHIYDPSKFWIVVKFQELELFQTNLFQHYYLDRTKYTIPEDGIHLDMYCVVYTDGNYYRGRVVGLPADAHTPQQVHVLFIDYGSLQMVDYTNVYYMSKKHCEVPQFAVRASLAEVKPRNSHWTVDDVLEFANLVTDKILAGVVVNVYRRRQVLDIHCKERNVEASPVHETLIAQKRAQYCDCEDKVKDEKTEHSLEAKFVCAHWFPCHEAIESGKVPGSLSDAEYEVMVAPFSPIVLRYYKVVET